MSLPIGDGRAMRSVCEMLVAITGATHPLEEHSVVRADHHILWILKSADRIRVNDS